MKKNYLITLLCSLAGLQASAQISFVASAQAVGSTTNVTVNKPAGVLPGHVMIAAVHCGWCNSGSTIVPPPGWTQLAQTSNTGSGCGASNTTIQLATFYKVAGASEPSSYAFLGNTNQLYVGGIVAYSGVNIVSPINASSASGAQDACSNIVAPGVTTTATCTKLVNVFICSVNSSAMNIVPTASLTERLDIGTTGNHPWGNENLEISDENFSTAGATGNRTAALSGCSSTGWITAGQMIALECATTTGISDPSFADLFVVSPNPSTGVLEITAQNTNLAPCKMEIYDALGKTVKKENIQESKTTVDLSTLPKGIYSLKFISTEGIAVKKIVLQ